MARTITIDLQKSLYLLLFCGFLIFGWTVILLPKINFNFRSTIKEINSPPITVVKATPADANINTSAVTQVITKLSLDEINTLYGADTLIFLNRGEKSYLQLNGYALLVTDQERPRISSKRVDSILSTFVNKSRVAKTGIIIETTTSTNTLHVEAVESFLMRYGNWDVQTEKTESTETYIKILSEGRI